MFLNTNRWNSNNVDYVWVFWHVILLVSIVLSADLETHKEDEKTKPLDVSHIVDGRIVLEHLQQCSYVIMHSKIGWRKVKICQFGSGKWIWLSIIGQFAVPAKSCNTKNIQYRPQKKSVINGIWQLLSVSNRSIIMIGPSGLLLVVPHIYALPVSVLWLGLQKINNKTWMWKILSTTGDALRNHDEILDHQKTRNFAR
jgi:hypothetical protein